MANLTPTFSALVDDLNAMKKVLQERANVAIRAEADILFSAYPEIRAISWTQYTPYFNDGDACHFSVNELEFESFDWGKLSGKTQEEIEGDSEDDWHEFTPIYDLKYTPRAEDPYLVAMYNDLESFEEGLQAIPELLEIIYDDHVQVYVSREGIEVQDYEHE